MLQGLMFRWGVDFAGPLRESERGNKWILVCIEHYTKWVELVALPTKSSANVAKAFLENVLTRHGTPTLVLTNQSTQFQGDFRTLLSRQAITHRVASREDPGWDGMLQMSLYFGFLWLGHWPSGCPKTHSESWAQELAIFPRGE